MADITKRVRTIFQTSGLRSMVKEGKQARAAFNRLGSSVQSLKRTLLGIGAAVGGIYVFRRGLDALVGYNKELETSRIALAAVLDLNTGIGKARAMDVAAGSMERLREIAKKNVGTFQDFLEVFNDVQGAVIRAGGDVKTAENIAKLGVPGAFSINVDVPQFSRDVSMILEGRAGNMVKTFRKLSGSIGMGATEFNRLGAPERLAKLTTALESFAPYVSEFEKSLSGSLDTFSDNIKIFLGKAGEPLFEKIKDAVIKINVWIEKNADEMERWASVIGDKLVKGFDAIVDAISWIVKNKDDLLAIGTALGGAFVASKLGGGFGMAGVAGGLLTPGSGLTASFSNLAGAASLLATEFAVLTAAAKALEIYQKKSVETRGDVGAAAWQLEQFAAGKGTATGLVKGGSAIAELGGRDFLAELAANRRALLDAFGGGGLDFMTDLADAPPRVKEFALEARRLGLTIDDVNIAVRGAAMALDQIDFAKMEDVFRTVNEIIIGTPLKAINATMLETLDAEKKRRAMAAARRKATPVNIKITVDRDPDRTAVVLTDKMAAEARRRRNAIGALAMGL